MVKIKTTVLACIDTDWFDCYDHELFALLIVLCLLYTD